MTRAPVYDVFLKCRCGHRAQIEMKDSPHLMQPKPRFVCRRCGGKNPSYDVLARFKGPPGMSGS